MLEGRAQLRIKLGERTGQRHAERTGLAADAAAVDGGGDVVGLTRLGDDKRFGNDHLRGCGREVRVERLAVDGELSFERD